MSSSSEECDLERVLTTYLSFEQELRDEGKAATETEEYNPGDVEGNFTLSFDLAFKRASFVLEFNNIKQDNYITAAYLKVGAAAVNGPIVVKLFSHTSPYKPHIRFRGTIKNKHIQNFSECNSRILINNIASLYQATKEGNVYVNIESTRNPEGMLRGQLGL